MYSGCQQTNLAVTTVAPVSQTNQVWPARIASKVSQLYTTKALQVSDVQTSPEWSAGLEESGLTQQL